MSDRKDFSNLINHLESKPGIYKMLSNGYPLYIGKAKDLRKRLKQYFMKTAPSHRIAVMLSQIDDIQVIITENEARVFSPSASFGFVQVLLARYFCYYLR